MNSFILVAGAVLYAAAAIESINQRLVTTNPRGVVAKALAVVRGATVDVVTGVLSVFRYSTVQVIQGLKA